MSGWFTRKRKKQKTSVLALNENCANKDLKYFHFLSPTIFLIKVYRYFYLFQLFLRVMYALDVFANFYRL